MWANTGPISGSGGRRGRGKKDRDDDDRDRDRVPFRKMPQPAEKPPKKKNARVSVMVMMIMIWYIPPQDPTLRSKMPVFQAPPAPPQKTAFSTAGSDAAVENAYFF